MFTNRSQIINSVGIRPLQFLRFKRTKLNKKGLAPGVVKLITQLSVMSASRKQPKMIKLCKEDLIKHEVITKLWSLLKRNESIENVENLQRQEALIREANEEFKQVLPTTFEKINNIKNFGKRFSLELRIPSKYPPRKIWNYDINGN